MPLPQTGPSRLGPGSWGPGGPRADLDPQCRGRGLGRGGAVGLVLRHRQQALRSPHTAGARPARTTSTPTRASRAGRRVPNRRSPTRPDAHLTRGAAVNSGPSAPLRASASATHRSGGLPGGGHDGRKRGRHVIAAHTPARPTERAESERKSRRRAAAPGLASGRDSRPAPLGARPRACAPAPQGPGV